jgi:hypothetical protein
MAFWPWSAVWTLLNDPVQRAFRRIFNYLREFYQRMSDRIFSDVAKDLPVSKE